MRLLSLIGLLATSTVSFGGMKTYDGRHDLNTIALTVVYFVPVDRTPLPDWKDRVDYYVKRIVAFHDREFDGQSKIVVTLHPKPLVTELKSASFRRSDQNQTFFSTMDEVKSLLKWKPIQEKGFPILLVLSDMNWRELDDFKRTRIVDGKEIHEGNIARNGRHFPGAESGGARATYIARQGYGMGLVSGDGWRVPYCGGSDCVVYHEGLGHTVGLPHPNPIDNSVMGTAQYSHWISESYLNLKQKEKLGWEKPKSEPDRSRDLFTHFRALHKPIVPKVGQEVELELKWPKDAKVQSLRIRLQTELLGKWEEIPVKPEGKPIATVKLRAFDKPTPVSYRVDAKLEDGQTSEIWGYFQVKK